VTPYHHDDEEEEEDDDGAGSQLPLAPLTPFVCAAAALNAVSGTAPFPAPAACMCIGPE
jgi:hypothetical protein